MIKILPSVTSIFDWRGKVAEIKALGLTEAALFLTCLNPKERRELFGLLEKTKIKEIPFVHLRSDHTAEELDYLIKNYHTSVFNIHTDREYPYFPDYKKYRKMIYIENTYEPLDEKEIGEFAGICLDLSHLENSRLFKPQLYEHNVGVLEKYGVGCNHLGPIKQESLFAKNLPPEDVLERHPHFLSSFSELDYLRGFPPKYFGSLIALEMENSIKDQLEAKNYIRGIIKI